MDENGFILQNKILDWIKGIITRVLRKLKTRENDNLSSQLNQLNINQNKVYSLNIDGNSYKVLQTTCALLNINITKITITDGIFNKWTSVYS